MSLQRVIEEQQERIDELQREIDEAAESASFNRWRDMLPVKVEEDDGFDLPVPRLEIRWVEYDDWNRTAFYRLVTRHFLGHLEGYALGATKCNGRRHDPLDLPFRDGAHICHDAQQLNLPAFVVNDSCGVSGKVDLKIRRCIGTTQRKATESDAP